MNKECPNALECKDKYSSHYFMCHMTQEEFSEIISKGGLGHRIWISKEKAQKYWPSRIKQ